MYDDHYGLSGRPFQLTPDPLFWFDTATHRKAMAYLGYGLSQGEGFVVITGDPGAGKTTLMGHLLGHIDRERLNAIKIVSSQLRPDDLLRMVASGLGVEAGGLDKASLLSAIERGLHGVARDGKRTLLIIDEAQALAFETLEELRMLSNFQAGGYALLQIFLLGQPEFRDTLQDARLEQLRQRVIAMHHLDPMAAEEVEPYMLHRLSCVGWTGTPRFTGDALAAMHLWSGGNPRRINQLAGRVLLYGAVEQIETFGADALAAVIADLDQDTPRPSYRPAPRVTPPPPPAAPVAPTSPVVTDDEPYDLIELAPLAAEISAVVEARRSILRESAMPRTEIFTPLPVIEVEPEPEPDLAPEPAPEPEPAPGAERDPEPAADPVEPPAVSLSDDPMVRIAELEAQMKQQDAALRRVLSLLVDWVENDNRPGSRPDLSALHGAAA